MKSTFFIIISLLFSLNLYAKDYHKHHKHHKHHKNHSKLKKYSNYISKKYHYKHKKNKYYKKHDHKKKHDKQCKKDKYNHKHSKYCSKHKHNKHCKKHCHKHNKHNKYSKKHYYKHHSCCCNEENNDNGKEYISVAEVIEYWPLGDILTEMQVSDNILGNPNHSNNSTEINYVSLGICGEIIVKMSEPVLNENGPDLRIWEVSNSNEQEEAGVYGSNDGYTWTFLGRVNNTTGSNTIDLGIMEELLYLKILDESLLFNEGDGFSIDAITTVNKK